MNIQSNPIQWSRVMRKRIILYAAALIFAGTGFQSASIAWPINGIDLVCNGESFFHASNICSELSRLARADGYLVSGENFKQIAVSGSPLANIVNFYGNCNPKPRYLVSDGGAIDLMQGDCSDVNCAKIQSCANTLKVYLKEMKKNNTISLLWMIYPDPQGSQWDTLKKNLDLWAQVVPPIINGCTSPRTLLVDLRPVWEGHYSQYTSDGFHCTNVGGTATAEAFWKAMKTNGFFDTPAAEPFTMIKPRSSAVLEKSVSNSSIFLSLFLAQPSAVSMRIMTISGKIVATVSRQEQVTGLRTIQFPFGAIAPGVYGLEVKADGYSEQSSLLLR
jgi:hypothetical protein